MLLTNEDVARIRGFAKWLSAPSRVNRLRELANQAWERAAGGVKPGSLAHEATVENRVPHPAALSGDEAVAKVARQYLCALVDQYIKTDGQESASE